MENGSLLPSEHRWDESWHPSLTRKNAVGIPEQTPPSSHECCTLFSSSLLQITMARHRFATEEIALCRRSLLVWYDANKRKLPWRDWHDADESIVAYRGWRVNEHCSKSRRSVLTHLCAFSAGVGTDASTDASGNGHPILWSVDERELERSDSVFKRVNGWSDLLAMAECPIFSRGLGRCERPIASSFDLQTFFFQILGRSQMLGWYWILRCLIVSTLDLGLGYYNRARNLHKSAQLVTRSTLDRFQESPLNR